MAILLGSDDKNGGQRVRKQKIQSDFCVGGGTTMWIQWMETRQWKEMINKNNEV